MKLISDIFLVYLLDSTYIISDYCDLHQITSLLLQKFKLKMIELVLLMKHRNEVQIIHMTTFFLFV